MTPLKRYRLFAHGLFLDNMVQVHGFCKSSIQYSFDKTLMGPRYYVLIATCLVAKKKEWLVNPCLAAALVLPAVAAIHGIVLTAMHNPGKT